MSNAQIGNLVGFVDKRDSVAAEANDSDNSLGANVQYYRDRGTMEARLTTLDGTTYTADVLRSMTHNDLVMALRYEQDSGSI